MTRYREPRASHPSHRPALARGCRRCRCARHVRGGHGGRRVVTSSAQPPAHPRGAPEECGRSHRPYRESPTGATTTRAVRNVSRAALTTITVPLPIRADAYGRYAGRRSRTSSRLQRDWCTDQGPFTTAWNDAARVHERTSAPRRIERAIRDSSRWQIASCTIESHRSEVMSRGSPAPVTGGSDALVARKCVRLCVPWGFG